jgi:3,4-dihydroxy 2-butanone 4-phosphate synthase / GTP cyclohydrolase II
MGTSKFFLSRFIAISVILRIMKSSVQEAIEAYKRGEFVVVVDDPDRENEGDLIIAASALTPEKMSFMLRYTSGVICAPMSEERAAQLQLPLMVEQNTESQRTAYTVSVDYKVGTTTGISRDDRTHTLRALADPQTKPQDLLRPGHIFPLKARTGGVLKRAGHTEAAVDLCRLAGLPEVGVICELVNPDFTVMDGQTVKGFAEEHSLPYLAISELIHYRRQNERLVERVSSARLPTEYGEFTAYAYDSLIDGVEHVALVMGDVGGEQNVLVRVHSECLTGDIFGSRRCDCGTQLHAAFKKVAETGKGVILYLRGQEGRGIGLGHKIRAYSLQDKGLDTVEANEELGLPVDSREYGVGAQILADLGLTTIHLMTNNPAKYGGIAGFGLRITKREPLPPKVTKDNYRYLCTKKEKMGHEYQLE